MGTPGLVCRADRGIAARVQVHHPVVVVGELLPGRLGDGREVVDVDERRDDGNALRGKGFHRLRLQPAGVFDAVDADGREVVQHLLPEAVGRDPGTLVVRGGERGGDGVARPAGGQVAGVPVDPVPHDLDPAVAAAGLLAHGLEAADRARPRWRSRGCSGGSGQYAGRPG
jgi:hypothetical protein